ncbi:DUF6902 family protein [Marinibacterium sp. SX1]|uniref:DUF6902 family protein n=1 Tax=Marinibacterium sp. SX1 TaxID=3388424 RepID=UPI003D167DB5
MSNVIPLNVPSRRQSEGARLGALLDSFAAHRRFGDDVFWLKENAELLNICECTGRAVPAEALQAHAGFMARIAQRMEFFPQYYRFLLSICLDVEDLAERAGLEPGTTGAEMVEWAARQGLARAEMSDLQRAEARRLMLRRGVDPLPEDTGLAERLHRFIDRSGTFQLPNKKAAYELTHIVFYLSAYGRQDPGLSDAAVASLEYAGILAWLDQNADLLAEVCVALRYAGRQPSEIWEDWIATRVAGFGMVAGDGADIHDDYHEFFVSNWALAMAGRGAFSRPVAGGAMSFHAPPATVAPLRALSDCLFRLDDRRSDDWERMRALVADTLEDEGRNVLLAAERCTERFGEFFAGFARTGLRGVAS